MSIGSRQAAIRARLRAIVEQGSCHGLRVLDLRKLEAPEPLEQALLEASLLSSGESFVAFTPRVPHLLLSRLAERTLDYVVEPLPDGTALVFIEHP